MTLVLGLKLCNLGVGKHAGLALRTTASCQMVASLRLINHMDRCFRGKSSTHFPCGSFAAALHVKTFVT
eukprot:3049035-Amphidinium_carterae.1